MKLNCFVLLLSLIVIVKGGTYEELTANLFDSYERCLILSNNKVMLFWTINASDASIYLTISAKTTGWVGLGFSKVIGSGMNNSDVIAGWYSGGIANVSDYFVTAKPVTTPCAGGVGVCPDSSLGGTNDITSHFTVTENSSSLVTRLTGKRLLDTGDQWDVPIINDLADFIFAFGTTDYLSYHTLGYSTFSTNFYTNAACKVGTNGLECSGNGICMGCCKCNSSFEGADCSTALQPPTATVSGSIASSSPDTGLASEIDPSRYPNSVSLRSDYTLYWLIRSDEIEAAIEVKAEGWVAFALSKDGTMENSDAIIAWFEGSNLIVDDYWITGRSGSCNPNAQDGKYGICTDTETVVGGRNNILEYNGNLKNGVIQVLWRRKLATGDTKGDLEITQDTLHAIFAFHPTQSGFPLSKHQGTNGKAQINFFSGDAQVIRDIKPLVHGSLMFVAWGVLIPLTGILARSFKKWNWWFHVHWGTNAVAVLASVVAFVVSLSMVNTHFDTGHKIIGLVIVCSSVIQAVIGILADRVYARYTKKNMVETRPEEETPIFPDKVHWVLGWGTLLLAIINILLGLLAYKAVLGLTVAYIIYGVFIFSILIIYLITSAFMRYKASVI